MRLILFAVQLALLPTYLFAQVKSEVHIIPKPVSLSPSTGTFILRSNTTILAADIQDQQIASIFNTYLKQQYGFRLRVVKQSKVNTIRVSTKKFIRKPDKDGYSLEVTKKGVFISGDTYAGTFYGLQTLLQLLPETVKADKKYALPCVSIADYPRFAYRGMHLDVARHFFPVSFVKRYIDYLAFHKMNTFHWHLTDDQGWRLEIKKYPRLTSMGGFRNGTITGRYPGKGNDSTRYGGYYTQEQIREVVKYASERYITIIPEIDVPGHSSAAIAAYPELSCFPNESTKIPPSTAWAGPTEGKQVQQTWGVFEDILCPSETTFKFLEDVMDEVVQLFPSPYIHIGGDEAPKDNWKRSELCQQLIKQNGLKDEHQLQSYFITRLEKYLNTKGRNIIGWDEILEGGLSPNATVMSWRGEAGGIAAAKQLHNAIMTPEPYIYFDWGQSKIEDSLIRGNFTPVEKVYGYEPVPKELDSSLFKYITGAQANVWTEYMNNGDKVEYMIFPRMSALSEVLWSPKENRDWKSFEEQLPFLFKRYELWKAHYSTAYYNIQSAIIPAPNNQGLLWNLTTNNKEGTIVYVKGSSTNAAKTEYSKPVLLTEAGDYGATVLDNKGKVISSWVWQRFTFNKATGKPIILKEQPSKNYPGSGAFTLVNGIITDKGLVQSSEWLGFLGKNMEATIDLGEETTIHSVTVNALDQNGSWIYLPKRVIVRINGGDSSLKKEFIVDQIPPGSRRITVPVNARIKTFTVVAENYGIIPLGQPGAGTPAWLFVDEIEAE